VEELDAYDRRYEDCLKDPSTWKAEGFVAGIKAFGAEVKVYLSYTLSLSPLSPSPSSVSPLSPSTVYERRYEDCLKDPSWLASKSFGR
jgi:hypothetical protein